MKRWHLAWGVVFGTLVLVGCQDSKESAAEDLREAGYALEADDWFRAAAGGQVQVAEQFLEAGFDLGTTDAAGDQALHLAAAAGAEAMADWLLDHGVDVNVPGASGRTAVAVAAQSGQVGMVRWLLRQGADPVIADEDGYQALTLAVREGRSEVVGELAPYVRGDLDRAMLLAALLGRVEVIDTLTNYGASVYARMDDGRTPLMIGAENGHEGVVRLLVDIGANRFAVDREGRTAADYADEKGHGELADVLRAEGAGGIELDEPGVLAAEAMAFVEEAVAGAGDAGETPWNRPMPGEGAGVVGEGEPAGDGVGTGGGGVVVEVPEVPDLDGQTVTTVLPQAGGSTGSSAGGGGGERAAGIEQPGLVMRHYRESELPLRVESVSEEGAVVRRLDLADEVVEVSEGDVVPGSRLEVTRIERRLDHSKLDDGKPTDVSVVEVTDPESGRRREWVRGLTASAHDPFAVVEDVASGRRFVAEPGARFSGSDGTSYVVADVTPNRVVIEELATGETFMLPLVGPRG